MKEELKAKILNGIFWVFLLLGCVLLVWKLVGNGPTDLSIYAALFIALISKVWIMSETVASIKGGLRSDIPDIKRRIASLEGKI